MDFGFQSIQGKALPSIPSQHWDPDILGKGITLAHLKKIHSSAMPVEFTGNPPLGMCQKSSLSDVREAIHREVSWQNHPKRGWLGEAAACHPAPQYPGTRDTTRASKAWCWKSQVSTPVIEAKSFVLQNFSRALYCKRLQCQQDSKKYSRDPYQFPQNR